MSLNDIRLQDTGGLSVVPSREYQVAASATTIKAGEPVSLETADGTATVIALADGGPTVSSAVTSGLKIIGIAATTSTNTASAAGKVQVSLAMPGIVVWKAKAKTASTADTQSEIDAKANDCIVLDATAGVYTVDFAAAHAATNGIEVVGGDPATTEIYFTFRPVVCEGKIS